MRQRHKIIAIAAEHAYLPTTRAVTQSVDHWARVLHKPLLYLAGGHPLVESFHWNCISRHLYKNVDPRGADPQEVQNISVTARHHAAVHIPDHAGNPARRVAQQEFDDRSYIAWHAHTADGVKSTEPRQRLADFLGLDERTVDGRFHHRWRNGIHANTMIRKFHRQMLRQ